MDEAQQEAQLSTFKLSKLIFWTHDFKYADYNKIG